MRTMLMLAVAFLAAGMLQAQPLRNEVIRDFMPRPFPVQDDVPVLGKRTGHYSEKDWAAAIDAQWGSGESTTEKLRIFDLFWDTIDRSFACFNGVDVDWDALYDRYRPEIGAGVSRGRFAAIMNHLSMALQESHTRIVDVTVSYRTAFRPGVPLAVVGGWGENGHFGAGLTPLPDSTLLVYKTVEEHPLGLVPGDIVLGYDGVPWKRLYREIIDAQLPLRGMWGSSEEAFTHSWLMSAGMNWHLFDTLDVVKYGTGDTLHFATSDLYRSYLSLFCSEQMDIPGVPKPRYSEDQNVSYGIVEGTRIGYIYGWAWSDNAGMEFYDAVRALMFDHETDGLIIDFRMNFGGNMFLSDEALGLLFNTNVETIDWAARCTPDDRLLMCPKHVGYNYVIRGSAATFYDKPIALLTGPGAVSSGDQVALRVAMHPRGRVFGKRTTTAFNAPITLDVENQEWSCRLAPSESYLLSAPDEYLTHRGFPVDEDVWLTPDDVARGEDTVVKAAMAWIRSLVSDTEEIPAADARDFVLSQNYPNPCTDVTSITYRLRASGNVRLQIIDAYGRVLNQIEEGKRSHGTHSVRMETAQLPAGWYLIRLDVDGQTDFRHMIVM